MIPVLLPGANLPLTTITQQEWPEAFHHVSRVRRAKPGASVLLGNGQGERVHCTISSIDKKEMCLEIVEILPVPEKPHIHLWIAHLEKAGLEEAVHLTAQVGIAAIHLVGTDRVVADPLREREKDRLHKICLNSCIQSEQAWIPELFLEVSPLETLEIDKTWGVAVERHPEENHTRPERITNVLIGPEGGWSEAERHFLQEKSTHLMDLGTSILRAQTAALIACWQATNKKL